MQASRKLGALMLVLVFAVSCLTAVPVLGADYVAITLAQTETGMTIGSTGTAVVQGIAEDGSKTALTEGVTFEVIRTGSYDVITVDNSGTITAECEGTAVLTATYAGKKASVLIAVGSTAKSLGYDSADQTKFTVSYPQAGEIKFDVDENDIPYQKTTSSTLTLNSNDASGKPYRNRYLYTDTTEMATDVVRSGAGSLHLKQINLAEQKIVGTDTPLTTFEQTMVNGKWARTGPFASLGFKDVKQGVMEFWFYDDGVSTSSFWLMGTGSFPRADGSTGTTQSIRGKINLGATYNFAKDGNAQPDAQVKGSVPRSVGWHQFVLDYSSPDAYVMYVDGTVIWSYTEEGRNAGGINGIEHDRTLSGTNATMHELWIDGAAIYDVSLSRALAPVVSDVTISGKAMVEQTLTASFLYSDANGDLKTGETYSWEKSANGTDGWTAIGTDSSSYTLTAADVGSYIRVGVVATNGAEEQNTSEKVYSEAFGPIEVKPDLEAQNFTKVDISHTKSLFLKTDAAQKVVITGVSDNGEYNLEDYEKVTYSMDDPYTATVSADGTITPQDVGYTILTATVENADGSTTSGKLFITVAATKNQSNFEGYTITDPEVNTHMKLSTDIFRTGATAMMYQKAPSTATVTKWGLDQYGGSANGYNIGEGWFYDNGAKDATGFSNIYFQSLTVRDTVDGVQHEYPYILNLNAGLMNPALDYYQVNNSAGNRKNRGPGYKTDYTGTENAGTGYLGSNTGNFVCDGNDGMPLIPRTKGWHQVILIAQYDDGNQDNIATENGKLTVYIDGIKALEDSYAVDGIGCVRGVGAASPNYAIYDDLSVSTAEDNVRPPLVTGMKLSGTAMVERSVEITDVDAFDKNGDKVTSITYQWQSSADGKTGWANVSGATAASYTFAEADQGKYFRVAVTPHTTVVPTDGDPAYSDVIGPVAEKKTEPWVKAGSYSITGEAKIGRTLTAEYTYEFDPVTGDTEGDTIVTWQNSNEQNGTYQDVGTGKTYNPTAADAGKFLRAAITPVDRNGLQGQTVTTVPVQVSTEVEYFVSTKGSDSNAGSFDAPFATITKARDVIREAIKQGLGEGSIIVNIMGGEYPVSSTIAFTDADSGTENCPITYRAYNDEKVTFTGSTVISADKVSKLTESDKDIYGNKILDRIQDPVAKSKIVKIDLSEYTGEIPVLSEGWNYSWETTWPKNTIPVDVYVNGSVIEPARWPNNEEDTAMFNPVAVSSEKTSDGKHDNTKPVSITYPDPDNETANWNQQAIKDDLMIAGYFGYHWYMQDHKVGEMDTENKVLKTLGGTAAAPATNLAYYLYNIIEAIDAPGEGYIDRKNKIAYFYPDSEIDETAEIRVAGNNSTLLSASGTKYINFQGLDFEYNRATAVSLSNVDHVTWDNCDVAHTGNNSMSASGTNITIQNSHIYDSGKNGLTISGGDRKTLTPSNNLITNNIFHDQGRAQKTYVPAIQISNCVGATISHNEIFNNHHEAIAYGNSNDIVIEYNDLHDVVTTSGDMGAIYCGRNVTEMGYVIRYNKIAHVGSKYSEGWSQSIFFDDGNSGAEIYGNIFYRGTLTMDKGAQMNRSFAVKTNGGQFFHVYNNIFVDMPSALQFQSWNTTGFDSSKQVRYIVYNNDTALTKSGDNITFDKTANYDTGSSQWKKFTDVGFNDGIWAEHYKGTIWEPIFSIFTQENHDKLVSYLPVKNEKGQVTSPGNPKAAADFVESIAPSRQNFFRDNVAVQIANPHITVQSNNETIGTNYTNAEITTADGKPLFVDYENENFQLTAEGLAEVRKTVADFPNVDTSKIGPQTPVDGSRPVASNVKLTGDNVPGGKAKVSYTYSDADNQKEVATTYQWYAAEAVDGDYELIRGEFTTELTIPNSLAGKYIKCVVTPSDSRLLPGKAVATAPVQVIADLSDVDKSELRKTIAEANELLSNATVGSEDGQYPQEAVDTLQALVDEAQAVANNPAALQFQVDSATEKLTVGMTAFQAKVITSMEFMSIKDMLADSENWTKYVGSGEFTIEDGVLTLPVGTGAAYMGEKYKNKIFVFKMKIDPAEAGATPSVINCSINFRAQNPAVLWSAGNMGYLWWMKPASNEAQFFQPNVLKTFEKGLIEIGKEYTVGVGVYDTAGDAVRLRLYLDDLETPVYEYDFTKEEIGGENLYGQDGYFMAASGAEVITKIYAVEDADKSQLQEAIAAAKALRAAAVQGDGYGEYTRARIDEFDAAIEKAEKVNNDSSAVQKTVDEFAAALENETASFKLSANKEAEVIENSEIAINYDLDTAKFTVYPGVSNAVVKMDPSKAQPMYQFIYKAAAGDVTVDAAKDTVFTASGWDGTFKLPVAGDTPSGTISGENFMVVTMGDADRVITSSELVRIVLPGQGGKLLAYKTEEGKYKTISKNSNLPADTIEAAKAALPNGGVAKLTVGNDLVIYTNQLTEFVAYNYKAATPDPEPSNSPEIPSVPSGSSGPSLPSGPVSSQNIP
ncbi:MAG: right-handed parallel beta-helix repeat-containing protein, partial [Clostridia bacterium]|nr:right-handed parallel beta-helix repeat-containing protein [Clostridia bacterium]